LTSKSGIAVFSLAENLVRREIQLESADSSSLSEAVALLIADFGARL